MTRTCVVPLKQLGWIVCIALKEKSISFIECAVKFSEQIFCN